MNFGNYELGEVIGAGGLGTVYRARTLGGEVVALKLIPRTSLERDARFEREVRSQATLGSELGFVPVLDAGVVDRFAFLVMPLLSGGCLASRLRHGPLPLPEAERLAGSLASSLAEAHGRGLIHRDLKPANILFDEAGRSYIADLGLAKRVGQEAGLSRTGEMRGTIGYMAPEQASNAKGAGPPADVYSWGAVMFEALTGRRAFEAAQPLEQLRLALEGRVPSVRELRPGVSPALAAAVESALGPDPSARPLDGAALLASLAEAPAPERGSRWGGVALASGALVLVALLALGVAALSRSRSAPPERSAPTAQRSALPGVSPKDAAGAVAVGAPEATGALRTLLAAWPADAPLRPRAVYGDGLGSQGEPLLALDWSAEGTLIGVGRTRVTTWAAQTGEELRSLRLPLAVDARSALVLDGARARLWITSSRKVQLWDLRAGTLLAEVATPQPYARLALAPEGDSVALASSRGIARWGGGAAGLEGRQSFRAAFAPHLVVLPGGEVVTGSDSELRVFQEGAKPEVAKLQNPLAELGGMVAAGGALYLLDKAGHLQCWDLRPLRLRYRGGAGLPAPGGGRRKKQRPYRSLQAAPRGLLLAFSQGPALAGARCELDLASGAVLSEEPLLGVEILAQGPGELLATGGGLAGTAQVWRGGEALWQRGQAAVGELALAPGGGAYTVSEEVVRWPKTGEPRRLEGDRAGGGQVYPTPEGDGYLRPSKTALAHWLDGASSPQREWLRATPGSPIGPGALELIVPLAGGRALGCSRETQFTRQGSTLTLSGQREVLTLFGAGEVEVFEWEGARPHQGIALGPERVRLIAPDRYGVFALRNGAWEEEGRFAQPTAKAAVFGPRGEAFVRWPGGTEGRELELWRWGGTRPRALLTPPGAGPAGGWACALGERVLVWSGGGEVAVWDLGAEPPTPKRLPLEALSPPQLGVDEGGEVWIETARGELVVLAPSPR